MPRYFADIHPMTREVRQVILAPSPAWCVQTLGGWWEETVQHHSIERFAARGLVFDPDDPRRFLTPAEAEEI